MRMDEGEAVYMDEPVVTQAVLEARMREFPAAGGGVLDMHGARVLITDPPLTVPDGTRLHGCQFEVHVTLPGCGEPHTVSYDLPDVTGGPAGGAVIYGDSRGHLYAEVRDGGTITGVDGIRLPDGGVLAEVPPE
jgi:hypothetical protein